MWSQQFTRNSQLADASARELDRPQLEKSIVSSTPTKDKTRATDQSNRETSQQAAEVISFAPLPAETDARVEFLRNEITESVDRLISDFPNEANPLSLRALVHSRFNRPDLAIEVWRECLKLDPQFVSAYTSLATIALEQDELEKAEGYLRKALEIQPTEEQARTSLAECLIKQNRPQEAIDLLTADAISESTPLIDLYHLGQAYSQLDELQSAVSFYQRAIDRAPNLTYAYYGLGTAYRKLGESEKAKQALKEFQKWKQLDMKARKELARSTDDETGLRKTAAHVHYITGDVYWRAQRLPTAVAHWIRSAKLDPKEIRARENLAQVFKQTQDLERVVVILKELCEIEKQNPNHRMNLGTTYAELGKLDAAQASFMEAIELSPDSTAALMATAEFLLNHQRDLNQARQLAQRGVELDDSAQNYAILAMTHASLQDFPAAVQALEQALAKDPLNPQYQSFKRQLTARLEYGNSQK